MLRHELSEMSLFDSKTTGPRPPSRPAVEALEERLALANGIDFGFGSVLNGVTNQALLGQLGNHPSPKVVEQAAKTLADRALQIAEQVEKGTISFADANQQINAMSQVFFKLKHQPGAQTNAKFRIASDEFRILKEYVQSVGTGSSQSLKRWLAITHPNVPSLKQLIRAIETGTPLHQATGL